MAESGYGLTRLHCLYCILCLQDFSTCCVCVPVMVGRVMVQCVLVVVGDYVLLSPTNGMPLFG